MNKKINADVVSFGLVREEEPTAFAVPCTAASCSLLPEQLAQTDRPHYKDSFTHRTYCEQCGNRLRYHRKKWSARGEEMPLTLEEVSARHAQK